MGARDYMFDLLADRAIMARVHEARDRFLDFREFWAERYKEAIDFTQLDEYFESFEDRARQNSERMCDDCIFTVANGASAHNPYREARRKRQEEGYDLIGRKVQFAKNSIEDPDANHLCIECENAWLDELDYGWELYCRRRIDCIAWGVPKDRPARDCVCRRLPDGKFMWYSYAIPGYTKEEAWKITETKASLGYYLGKIVEQKTKKNFISRLKEMEEKHKRKHVRKELLLEEIQIVIAEQIREDGEKLAAWEAGSEERSRQVWAEIRMEFVSRTVEKYGEGVLNAISLSDIAHYSIEVEAGGNESDLWYAVLKKYEFDQTTDSCLYFIKQGTATKIGITDSLDVRFAQIKTSAAFPCEIANVLYTHFGYELEQKLHRQLRRFNSHLEWFVLPPEIEARLFKVKSRNDIENFLQWFEEDAEHYSIGESSPSRDVV